MTQGRGPRVIFVNRFYFPDESATSVLLSDLASSLAASTFDVEVVTGRSHYRASSEKLASRDMKDGVLIRRLPTIMFDQASLIGRVMNFIIFYIGSFLTLVRIVRPNDLVVCLTDPPLSAFPAFLATKIRRGKFANWIQDVFPETASVVLLEGRMRRASEALRALRNLVWRKSDMNVVIGERMRQYVVACGVAGDAVHRISNWIDEEVLLPSNEAREELRARWQLGPDDFVVMYSGNLGRAHDVTAMIDAIRLLEARQPHGIRFVFVGGGARTETMRTFVAQEAVTSVRFVDFQARARLADSLSVGDTHWMSLLPALEGYILPSKFYGAVAVGRPVVYIGDSQGEFAEVLTAFECGVAFEPHEGAELADWLLQASSSADRNLAMGRNARRLATTVHRRADRIAEWRCLLDRTIGFSAQAR